MQAGPAYRVRLLKLWVVTSFGIARCKFGVAKQIQNNLAGYIRIKSFCNPHKKINYIAGAFGIYLQWRRCFQEKYIKNGPVVKSFCAAFLGVILYFTLSGVYYNVCVSCQL